MVAELIKRFLLRVFLPASFLIAALLRPSLLSIVYATLALVGPAFPTIRRNVEISILTRLYSFVCFSIALAASVGQLAYQLVEIFTQGSEAKYAQECATNVLEKWMRQIGFIRVPFDAGAYGLLFVAPELIALLASLTTMIVCLLLPTQNQSTPSDQSTSPHPPSIGYQDLSNSTQPRPQSSVEFRLTTSAILPTLKRVSDVGVLIMLGAMGIVEPSALNAVYFLAFLGVMTWWAWYIPLHRRHYNAIKSALILYTAGHFILLCAYQIPILQELISPSSLVARLIGLTSLIRADCVDPWWEWKWPSRVGFYSLNGYANLACLLAGYHLLIAQLQWTSSGVIGGLWKQSSGTEGDGDEGDGGSSVHEELLATPSGSEEDPSRAETANKLQRITSEMLDRQKIQRLFRRSGKDNTDLAAGRGSKATEGLQEFIFFLLSHCYVFALLTMMTWALLYHSVFGLLLLLTACVLWALRDSRAWCFQISPALLLFAEFLLLAQYMMSLNVNKDDLPQWAALNGEAFQIVGFIPGGGDVHAVVTLAVKLLLSLPLFVLHRLNFRDRFINSLTEHDRLKRLTNYGTFHPPHHRPTSNLPSTSRRLQAQAQQRQGRGRPGLGEDETRLQDSRDGFYASISHFFTKWWIFVVAGLLLLTATGENVYYTAGFFIFFALFVVNLQISFRYFTKSIVLYLTLLIIYASVVLVSIYSYNFKKVPYIISNLTHQWLNGTEAKAIGLIDTNQILPIGIIVVTMLQLKLFHDPWTKMVNAGMTNAQSNGSTRSSQLGDTSTLQQIPSPSSRPTDPRESTLTAEEVEKTVIREGQNLVHSTADFLWRMAEVHGLRFILFVLVSITVHHYCALNFVIILLVDLALCLPALGEAVAVLMVVYMSGVFISRRIYQPSPSEIFSKCLDVNMTGEFNTTAQWIGYDHHDTTQENLHTDLQGLVVVIVLLGAWKIVQYRQRQKRRLAGQPDPSPTHNPLIFLELPEPEKYDESLVNCWKALFNFGFYKFGLEISMALMAIVAYRRMDFLSAVLLIWLAIFITLPRQACRRLWPVFIIYLAVMFPLQYAMIIEWCIRYPWTNLVPKLPSLVSFDFIDNNLDMNLSHFFDLADYRQLTSRFDSYPLWDFFLLAVVTAQERVFREETASRVDDDSATQLRSNESIYAESKGRFKLHRKNPHRDFLAEQRSFVDFLKIAIFTYGHWITIVWVLIAGLAGASLFALGYLLLAFWMLWQGNNLYTMNDYGRTLKWWKITALYTVLTMLCKVVLQVFACVFLVEWLNCDRDFLSNTGIFVSGPYIVKLLFGISCVSENSITNINKHFEDNGGQVYTNCSTAENFLQSQAGEIKILYDTLALIFILFQLRVLNSWYFQQCIVEFRCEMIQAKRGAVLINQLIEKEMREQNDQQNKKLREIKQRTAAIRESYEKQQLSAGGILAFTPQTYGQAKRAGDYYMFGNDPDIGDELIRPIGSFVPEVTPGATDFDKLDPIQLLYAALGKELNFSRTLSTVGEAEKIKDEELRMIAAVGPTPRARELAAKALYTRQHPDRAIDSSALREVIEAAKREYGEGGDHEDGAVLVKMRRHRESPAEEVPEREKEHKDEPEKTETWHAMVVSTLLFVWKILLNALEYIAAFLNRRSREHRYVAYVLNKEKERLKVVMVESLYDAERTPSQLRMEWEQRNMHLVTSEQDINRLEDEAHNRWEERNVFARIVIAVMNCSIAHTDILCFFLAAVAHACCAGIITLPLPLLVFFWGSLSAPRPSKLFWISMIAYTEFVIVTKFIFQFGFWQWNTGAESAKASPYSANYVIGIQAQRYYALGDVSLLISLFFHRYMLRRLGLWKDANNQATEFTVSMRHTTPPEYIRGDRPNNGDDHPEGAGEELEGTPLGELRSASTTVSTVIAETNIDAALPTSTQQPEKSPSASERKKIVVEVSGDGTPPSVETIKEHGRGGGADSEIDLEKGLPITDGEENQPGTSTDRHNRQTSPASQRKEQSPGGETIGTTTTEPERDGFFQKLLKPKFRYIRDLYPVMFLLDVVCFFIVAFGYSSFGEGGSGQILDDIKSSRIPFTFAIMLIVISLMIVIDRALYLRKAVISKLIYQLLSVVFLHVWIFFVLPNITNKKAAENKNALYLYGFKCVYFIVSAWQIRNGYPSLCIGNLLTHSYGLLNMIMFRIFYIVPFLFELRTAIDWTWTDTSMPLFDYFNMENFYATIYNLKCARTFEQSFPAPRGEAKSTVVKYLMGVPMILVLILIIWLPFLGYALVNKIGDRVVPSTAQFTVSVEGYPPLYTVQAQGVDLMSISEADRRQLVNKFSDAVDPDLRKQAVAFINEYEEKSILRARFRPESEINWLISDDTLEALKTQLNTTIPKLKKSGQGQMMLNIRLEFIRSLPEPQKHTTEWQILITSELGTELSKVLTAKDKKNRIRIHEAFPLYVIVPSEGQVRSADNLLLAGLGGYGEITRVYNNITLELKGLKNKTGSTNQDAGGYMHWNAQTSIVDAMIPFSLPPTNVTYGDPDRTYVEVFAFVDRVLPSVIGKYLSGGIIAIYMGLILLMGKAIRSLIASNPLDVIISEIPNPDYLLKICLDIYLVREARDFVLEQDLFAKLIFLFRSPATLIKWTRYKIKED